MAAGLRTVFGGWRFGVRSAGAERLLWNVVPTTTTSIAVFAKPAISGVIGPLTTAEPKRFRTERAAAREPRCRGSK